MRVMQKLAFGATSFLCVWMLILTPLSAHAAGAWGTVGDAGFSDNDINYPQIAFTSNGTPYVVYADDAGSFVYKLSAKRFNGTSWAQVGSPHFSAGDVSVVEMKMSPTNVPYVAYSDGTQDYKMTVERFNGIDWELVGPAGFTAGEPDGHDLAFAPDGTPYIVFANSSDNRRLTVMRYNGSSWVQVGASSFTPDTAAGVALAITSTGVPYVVYMDHSVSNKLSAMRFDGTDWVQAGTAGFSPGAALPDADGFEIGAGDQPYVAYTDVANGLKISVMKFNGTSWVQVGSAGFSAGQVSVTRMAMTTAGSPYVVYRDSANGDKPTVQRFNGTDWELVGSAGFTAGIGYEAVMSLSNRNIPYVAYVDDAQSFKLSVSRFIDGPDQLADPASVSVSNAGNGQEANIQTSFGTKLSCHSTILASSLAKTDASYSYPLGLTNFCFTTDFASNHVTLTFITDLKPADVVVRKYNTLSQSYATVAGAQVAQTTLGGHAALLVSYDIADNGPLDENPAVGAITDPVGIATAVAAPDTGFNADSSNTAPLLIVLGLAGLLSVALAYTRTAQRSH